MEMHLRSEGLYHLVDPAVKTSDSPSSQTAPFRVVSLFINHVDDQNLAHIFNLKSPQACWDTLKAVHQTVSLGHKLNIIRDFFTPGETFSSISEQVSHMQTLQNTLLAIYPSGSLQISELTAIALLWSQGQTQYNPLVQVFLQNNADNVIDISDVAPLLLNEEHRLKSTSTGQAFHARPKAHRVCTHCKRSGHLVESCFQLYPHLRRNKPDTSLYFGSLKSSPSTGRLTPRSWIVDSGCTSHITSESTLFEPTSAQRIVLQTANGSMISPTQGQISFPGLTLKNVLLCPDATHNLLSVSKLCDAGLTVTFTSSGWRAANENQIIVCSGPRTKGTFLFHIDECCLVTQSAVNTDSVMEWHRRLGHLSLTGLQHLARNGTGSGLPKEILSVNFIGKIY
jgi:hypothetical protein